MNVNEFINSLLEDAELIGNTSDEKLMEKEIVIGDAQSDFDILSVYYSEELGKICIDINRKDG